MTLCTGLTILGLCLPLPGHLRSEIEAAGWQMTDDGAGWWSARWFASGTYKLLVGVSGSGRQVQALIVAEPQSDYPRLGPLLDKQCSPAKGVVRACHLAGRELSAMQCFGGWMISEKGKVGGDLKLREQCEKLSPLFEGLLKEKQ